jgi:hypothetical protein
MVASNRPRWVSAAEAQQLRLGPGRMGRRRCGHRGDRSARGWGAWRSERLDCSAPLRVAYSELQAAWTTIGPALGAGVVGSRGALDI